MKTVPPLVEGKALRWNLDDANSLLQEARAEIERLQAEVTALTASNEIMRQASENYNAEIERLRGENEDLRGIVHQAGLMLNGYVRAQNGLKETLKEIRKVDPSV